MFGKRGKRKSKYTNFDIYYDRICTNIKNAVFYGKKKSIMMEYKKILGKDFDIDNPRTFNEKINARKIEKNPLYEIICDKYAVREYVKKKLGNDKILIPLIYVGDKGKKITKDQLNVLKGEYVLKTTIGSGTNIIVKEKDKDNIDDIVDTINEYLHIPFRWIGNEFFYKKKNCRIIAEKLLSDNGKLPKDYKFHCFRKNGKLKIIIQVVSNRFEHETMNFYDENWNPLNIYYSYPIGKTEKKPKALKKMLELANKLSEDFNYIRVDLYLIKNKIYFGELTLTHCGGFANWQPDGYDEMLGDYWG